MTSEILAWSEIPTAIDTYLIQNGLPRRLACPDDPELRSIAWDSATSLELVRVAPGLFDDSSIATAFCGIAETGTLVMFSLPLMPARLSFVPPCTFSILPASRIVASLEEALAEIRESCRAGGLPRTIHLISGVSSSGDIEHLVRGAHGPLKVHVMVIDDR